MGSALKVDMLKISSRILLFFNCSKVCRLIKIVDWAGISFTK